MVIEDVLDSGALLESTTLFHGWYDFNKPQRPPHGVQKFYNCGQSAFAWSIRTNPKVQQVFAELWKTPDLVTSFDGYCYWAQGEKRRNTNWLHRDQSLKVPDFCCVQGLVALSTNFDCGFKCIPGSHLFNYPDDMIERSPKSKHWFKFTDDEVKMIGVPEVIGLDEGSMLIWDSRLVHQNWYGDSERLVQYVCMTPRKLMPPKQAAKRQVYFEQGRTTSHWPYPVHVNPLQPQHYGDLERAIDYSQVGEFGRGILWKAENLEAMKKLV